MCYMLLRTLTRDRRTLVGFYAFGLPSMSAGLCRGYQDFASCWNEFAGTCRNYAIILAEIADFYMVFAGFWGGICGICRKLQQQVHQEWPESVSGAFFSEFFAFFC